MGPETPPRPRDPTEDTLWDELVADMDAMEWAELCAEIDAFCEWIKSGGLDS